MIQTDTKEESIDNWLLMLVSLCVFDVALIAWIKWTALVNEAVEFELAH